VSEPLLRRATCEGVATAFLLATIVGSGIAGAKLADGNLALALLANSLATGAMLAVLILIFGPVSGAHMNPAVSLALAVTRAIRWRELPAYVVAQIVGAVGGVLIGNLMFDLPAFQVSTTVRSGTGQLLSECVATLGLLLTVFGCAARASPMLPFAVGLYIMAAYWFTASTSFANPAVTLARSLTDTFAGIAPANVPLFIVAQLVGVGVALGLRRLTNEAAA
jgi:glycerol uptake facilitator-like aquaporin